MPLKDKISRNIGIDKYVANINKHGIASPNRYWVEFHMPQGVQELKHTIGPDAEELSNPNVLLGSISSIDNELNEEGSISIMCTSSQMPARTLATNQHKHQNYPINLPYAVNYDQITFGFILSEDFKERRYFELWQEAVVNVKDGSMNFYSEYTTNLYIHQLDKNSNITYSVELIEAYPVTISNVDHSYATQNDLLNMSVTFSYKYWRNLDDGTVKSRRGNNKNPWLGASIIGPSNTPPGITKAK